MLKIIVASVAALGMAAANAGSIGGASQGSAGSTSAAYDGSTAGSLTVGAGFSDALILGASQLNSQAIGDGSMKMVEGSAAVVVTGIEFGKASATVSVAFVDASATFVVEVSTDTAKALYKGSVGVLDFSGTVIKKSGTVVKNTVGDSVLTVVGQMDLSLQALSQGNLNASLENAVMTIPLSVEALMTPSTFHADKYRN